MTLPCGLIICHIVLALNSKPLAIGYTALMRLTEITVLYIYRQMSRVLLNVAMVTTGN